MPPESLLSNNLSSKAKQGSIPTQQAPSEQKKNQLITCSKAKIQTWPSQVSNHPPTNTFSFLS
jgi:hypothetical protein